MTDDMREVRETLIACQKFTYVQRAIEALERIEDAHKGELEQEREAMAGEICVRQSELDDIAEIVGVQKDAPYATVRDKVAELARAGAQLRMA